MLSLIASIASHLAQGIFEMVQSFWHRETIYCQKGLGFIRLAMETGTNLVPCYSFGENQIFRGQ